MDKIIKRFQNGLQLGKEKLFRMSAVSTMNVEEKKVNGKK